jgi:hypothetical protein
MVRKTFRSLRPNGLSVGGRSERIFHICVGLRFILTSGYQFRSLTISSKQLDTLPNS